MFASGGAPSPSSLEDLLQLLDGWEDAAARAIEAGLADPVTLSANGSAFEALAALCAALPEVRFSLTQAEPKTPHTGLDVTYPDVLLAGTRTGWAASAAGLLGMALLRGVDPMSATAEIGALQARLATENKPALAPTPRKLHWSKGPARLWRLGTANDGEATPLVVVASLVNRFYLLDLLDGQSLLQRLVAETNRPVYLLDWVPGGGVDLEDTFSLLTEAIESLGKVSLLGYSMGGTLATVVAARRPELVESLAVFGAPIDTSRGGKFADWAVEADFSAVANVGSAVPAPWVHAPFWALRPTVNFSKLCQLIRRWREDGYLERFLAVELWNNDNVEISSSLYEEWGQKMYKDNALWTGDLADLGAIECPTLAIAASQDGIVPAAATLALAERTGGQTATVRGGHVGTLAGRGGLAALCDALIPFVRVDDAQVEGQDDTTGGAK